MWNVLFFCDFAAGASHCRLSFDKYMNTYHPRRWWDRTMRQAQTSVKEASTAVTWKTWSLRIPWIWGSFASLLMIREACCTSRPRWLGLLLSWSITFVVVVHVVHVKVSKRFLPVSSGRRAMSTVSTFGAIFMSGLSLFVLNVGFAWKPWKERYWLVRRDTLHGYPLGTIHCGHYPILLCYNCCQHLPCTPDSTVYWQSTGRRKTRKASHRRSRRLHHGRLSYRICVAVAVGLVDDGTITWGHREVEIDVFGWYLQQLLMIQIIPTKLHTWND